MNTTQKLHVLAKLANRLYETRITWAVGGSLLLYFQGIATDFHDIDLVVKTEDAQAMREVLLRLGTLEASKPSAKFKTKEFMEFTIDGVEVDVLAGFAIVKDGVAYDCSLQENEITEYATVENERIPLQAVAAWRRYYTLMGKTARVEAIDKAAK